MTRLLLTWPGQKAPRFLACGLAERVEPRPPLGDRGFGASC
ncbi:MAG: hypothetical protein RL733_268, partial [Actinomycetota bacterium]